MYYRLCEGLNDKGKLIPDTDNVYKYIDQNKDYYLSVYKYNEEQKKIFEKQGSIAGIRNVVTNKLIFDFDSEDLEKARKDTLETINRLSKININKEEINIYYSGSKGFHLSLETDKTFTPKQAKQIAKKIAGDLPSFDSVVYNSNRILRIPYTLHQKSNLYKIPLDYEELKDSSIEDIKNISKEMYDPEEPLKTNLSEDIYKLIETKEKKEDKLTLPVDLDLKNKPKDLSPWKYALELGYFPPGQRSNSLMILASTYKNLGYSETKCYYALKAAADLQAKRFNQNKFSKAEIYDNIISQIYGDHWLGGSYAEENFPEELKKYFEKQGIPRMGEYENKGLESIDDIYDTFDNYATNIEKNTIHTGIPGLDKICRITTSMLVGLLGSAASGKTASTLNILNKMSKSGEESVFFSLDMGKPLVYQKLAQKVTGKSGEEVFKIFKEGDEKTKKLIRDRINENYKNVQMCFRTGATVQDLRNYIINYQEKTGKKVRLVAVDYLEKVMGPYSDPTVNAGAVAKQLQELANDLELCVLMLLQPQKMAGTPADALLSYRQIKGASVIEQDCRVIISLWREGYNPQNFNDDDYITYAVLKNTMGKTGQVDCKWIGKTGEVKELEDIERKALAELRQKKKEEELDNKHEI